MVAALLVVLFSLALSNAAVAPEPQTVNFVFGFRNCLSGCSQLEIDIGYQSPVVRNKPQLLANLIPATSYSDLINSTTFTAFDNTTRTFSVAVSNPPASGVNSAKLFAGVVGNDAASITMGSNCVVPFAPGDILVRLVAITGNTHGDLLAIFQMGNALVVDSASCATFLLGNIVPTNTAGKVSPAIAADLAGANVYSIVLGSDAYIVGINAVTGVITSNIITVQKGRFNPREDWGKEVTFDAVFIPASPLSRKADSLIVFNRAVDPQHGFDQMLAVGINGVLQDIFYNMLDADIPIGFNVDSQIDDDTLQQNCYDAASGRLYMMVNTYSSDDDASQMSQQIYFDLSDGAKFPVVHMTNNIVEYGYAGVHCVPILN